MSPHRHGQGFAHRSSSRPFDDVGGDHEPAVVIDTGHDLDAFHPSRTAPRRRCPSATTPSPWIVPTACSPPSCVAELLARSDRDGPDTDRSTTDPATDRPAHASSRNQIVRGPQPGMLTSQLDDRGPPPPVASDADTTTASSTYPPTPPDPRPHNAATSDAPSDASPRTGPPHRSPTHLVQHLEHSLIALLHNPNSTNTMTTPSALDDTAIGHNQEG